MRPVRIGDTFEVGGIGYRFGPTSAALVNTTMKFRDFPGVISVYTASGEGAKLLDLERVREAVEEAQRETP